MRTVCRLGGLSMLAAAAVLALSSGPGMLISTIVAGLSVHLALGTGARAVLHAAVPVVIFATALTGFQWLGDTVDIRLPLRVIAVFALSTAAARLLPPPGLTSLSPRSRFRIPVLFLLLVRHFSLVLIAEVKRTFQARALCISSNYNRSSFQSLVWATAAVFRRSFDRAERFYAAQMVGGLEE
ncbi:MAG: hypothetical protein OZ929_23960 [Bryobacterales bacterium]|nr:hypothetical protein [Bryobacterales bacterium]